jgi:hypothetical protein
MPRLALFLFSMLFEFLAKRERIVLIHAAVGAASPLFLRLGFQAIQGDMTFLT